MHNRRFGNNQWRIPRKIFIPFKPRSITICDIPFVKCGATKRKGILRRQVQRAKWKAEKKVKPEWKVICSSSAGKITWDRVFSLRATFLCHLQIGIAFRIISTTILWQCKCISKETAIHQHNVSTDRTQHNLPVGLLPDQQARLRAVVLVV